MKKQLIYIISSVIISVLVSYLLLNQFGVAKNQAYVDTVKVFNEFDLKKKLEKKMENILKRDKQVVDSLKLELKLIYDNTEKPGNERFVQIRGLQNKIDEHTYQATQNEAFYTDKYNTQIWKQLNQYIKEFGREEGIDLLYGANGQGTILYAKEKYDYTHECIVYINAKYYGDE